MICEVSRMRFDTAGGGNGVVRRRHACAPVGSGDRFLHLRPCLQRTESTPVARSVDGEDDLAHRRSRFYEAVGGGGVGEAEHSGHVDRDPPRLDESEPLEPGVPDGGTFCERVIALPAAAGGTDPPTRTTVQDRSSASKAELTSTEPSAPTTARSGTAALSTPLALSRVSVPPGCCGGRYDECNIPALPRPSIDLRRQVR